MYEWSGVGLVVVVVVREMGVYLGWLRCGGTPHCRVWLPAKLLCYQGNMLQPGIRGEQPNLTVFGLFFDVGASALWPTSQRSNTVQLYRTHTWTHAHIWRLAQNMLSNTAWSTNILYQRKFHEQCNLHSYWCWTFRVISCSRQAAITMVAPVLKPCNL